MDQNLRRAVERVNAWHLARVLARTASLDADSRDDLPADDQPTSSIDGVAVSRGAAAGNEPPSSTPDDRQRVH